MLWLTTCLYRVNVFPDKLSVVLQPSIHTRIRQWTSHTRCCLKQIQRALDNLHILILWLMYGKRLKCFSLNRFCCFLIYQEKRQGKNKASWMVWPWYCWWFSNELLLSWNFSTAASSTSKSTYKYIFTDNTFMLHMFWPCVWYPRVLTAPGSDLLYLLYLMLAHNQAFYLLFSAAH